MAAVDQRLLEELQISTRVCNDLPPETVELFDLILNTLFVAGNSSLSPQMNEAKSR
jgi:hypothetical protein